CYPPAAGGASMSRSFVAVGATIAALLLGSPALANSYHVRVRAGGPVGVVRGPVGVVRGPVVVRPGYVRGPGRVWVHRPYYGYRTYGNRSWSGYSYPARAAPVAYAEPYAAPAGAPPPPPTVVARRAERDPSIGVGISASAIRSGTDHPASEGLGALMRF